MTEPTRDIIDDLIDAALAAGENRTVIRDPDDACKACKRDFHGFPKDGCRGIPLNLDAIQSQGVLDWSDE